MITNSKKDEVKIWIRHEKSRYKHAFRIRLGTKMHKLFNAWCRRFGGGKPVTAFRFFFKGKLIDGEQTAADIDIRRAIDLDVADYINVTSLPEVTLPITRSNSKKIRENVRRLPHEVEATLPSWVKCTDPIPREILEEVRSTVLVWMKNVRNYVEETETYILNDEHAPPEVVDDEWALVVERDLCFDPHLRVQFFRHAYYEDTEQNAQHIEDDYAEGVGRFAAYDSDTDSDTETGKRFTGWSRFIRRMILCDVNTFISKDVTNYVEETEITDIVVGSRKESQSEDGRTSPPTTCSTWASRSCRTRLHSIRLVSKMEYGSF